MNIIIPMAGRGSRLRPHTLTTPKPLLPIAGKAIVHRLVEDIVKVCGEKVEEIGFVIGDFGKAVEEQLRSIADQVGAKGKIYYQEEALGTAHAIMCAKDTIKGETVVAFADTLFKADMTIDTAKDGVIFVQRVKDPSAFGVVKLDREDGTITDFVEKPTEFVSDMAIIGIYYFKDGNFLKGELQHLLDNKIMEKGEYQLTNALESMKAKGTKFYPGAVEEWLDCGNKDATVHTNQRYLEYIKDQELVDGTSKIINSVVIPPCHIGKGAVLENSVVGPHVSIGKGTIVRESIVRNSIIGDDSRVNAAMLDNSMVGNFVTYAGRLRDVSLGDYSKHID